MSLNAGTIWMKVKSLDKRIENFKAFSFLTVLIFASLIALFTYIYRYFTIDAYNNILLVFILLLIIITVVITFAMFALLHAYRKRNVSPMLLIPVRLGMKMVIPFTIFITGFLGRSKDTIRSFFIDINNIFVQSGKYNCKPEQILVLLPHCLQNSECGFKITNDINNCKQCGRCSIGSILGLVREKGVRAIVVTGGTAARNLVSMEKPEMLLSVACERDLAIGISDVSSIPVIGVVNERPNGPCFNTTVNVELLGQKLESLIDRDGGIVEN